MARVEGLNPCLCPCGTSGGVSTRTPVSFSSPLGRPGSLAGPARGEGMGPWSRGRWVESVEVVGVRCAATPPHLVRGHGRRSIRRSRSFRTRERHRSGLSLGLCQGIAPPTQLHPRVRSCQIRTASPPHVGSVHHSAPHPSTPAGCPVQSARDPADCLRPSSAGRAWQCGTSSWPLLGCGPQCGPSSRPPPQLAEPRGIPSAWGAGGSRRRQGRPPGPGQYRGVRRAQSKAPSGSPAPAPGPPLGLN
mmetsp:Transcript_10637/g.18888  ORF Transcript_10637/g.18888 Transcript_10637/m.18888 type:complete len:247 (+) Transcript_10637:1702-2442(+)